MLFLISSHLQITRQAKATTCLILPRLKKCIPLSLHVYVSVERVKIHVITCIFIYPLRCIFPNEVYFQIPYSASVNMNLPQWFVCPWNYTVFSIPALCCIICQWLISLNFLKLQACRCFVLYTRRDVNVCELSSYNALRSSCKSNQSYFRNVF